MILLPEGFVTIWVIKSNCPSRKFMISSPPKYRKKSRHKIRKKNTDIKSHSKTSFQSTSFVAIPQIKPEFVLINCFFRTISLCEFFSLSIFLYPALKRIRENSSLNFTTVLQQQQYIEQNFYFVFGQRRTFLKYEKKKR